MRKPSPALIGSIALHGGVAALALIGWTAAKEEPRPLVNSVPVTIVSEMVIEAAAADNPQPEPSPEDGATAPVETTTAPPEPAPAPPESKPTPPAPAPTPPRPTPTPRPVAPPPPKKAETPRPTPPRETPRPTPPREQQPTPPREIPRPNPPRETTPPRKTETPRNTTPAPSTTPPRNARPAEREAPGLDLDALAGPARPTGTTGRPSAGQQGRGSAPQATGPQITAIFNQVYPHWILPCDIPGADQLRIQVDVTLSEDGRITKGPTLVNPQNTPVYRAASEGALRALRQAAPFDVPANFPGGPYRPTFNTERACANR